MIPFGFPLGKVGFRSSSMNPPQTASGLLKKPIMTHKKDLGEIARSVQTELDQVRTLIAERVFMEESFGELLVATGEKLVWEKITLPSWLESVVYKDTFSTESRSHLMARHLASQGGKLFRATLILLTTQALNPRENRSPRLATAMELIHLATLLHDDVIDRAEVRRGSPSLPSIFDNSPTVLMGDHLFARAFELIAECGLMSIISSSCRATSAMCRGEIEQLHWIGRLDVNEETYFRLIEMKTAALMGSCTESAALLCGQEACQGDWYRFGLNLGLLFQMTDDLLDLTGDANIFGKQTGSDFTAGKYTLPLILLRNRLGSPEALQKLFDSPQPMAEIQMALQQHGVLNEVRDHLNDLVESCRTLLAHLGDQLGMRESLVPLEELVEFVVSRDR
ncbi:MAG: polyprenyl synthetase family protein [Candidatus Omnitrophica bacterium COP1]|nr:polyprenyl synthetase family protein [Candidatus Omnitrophica bacterium COP1]